LQSVVRRSLGYDVFLVRGLKALASVYALARQKVWASVSFQLLRIRK